MRPLLKYSGISAVLDFIFPPLCLLCEAVEVVSEHLVCESCWRKVNPVEFPFCSRCRTPLTDKTTCSECVDEHAIPVFALGTYTDPLKEIVHRYKYHGYKKLAAELSREFLNRHRETLIKRKIDCLVSVPLHSHREKIRGFNQAAILADIIGNGLKLPVDKGSLEKIRKTRDQARLDPRRREANIKNAFRVYGNSLKGKKVIIVDDVTTTGSTIQEACRALAEAGAKPCAACVIAVAGL